MTQSVSETEGRQAAVFTPPVLDMVGIEKRFPIGKHQMVHAVNGVDIQVAPGEVVGLVGESGSGKSTLGRIALGLVPESEGAVRLNGQLLSGLKAKALRRLRADMQIVFQDPWSALNPRMTIGALIEEPLRLHTTLSPAERRAEVERVAARVRLSPAMLGRHAAELSGGQLQRACIARALITKPRLLVLDEPTSSLDLSVRAGILELLRELRTESDVGMLFITHDLGSLRLIADRIVVLYLGSIMEQGTTQEIFDNPQHPYTRALLNAHLSSDPAHRASSIRLTGEPPSPIRIPEGCLFQARCPLAEERCGIARPALKRSESSRRRVACIKV